MKMMNLSLKGTQVELVKRNKRKEKYKKISTDYFIFPKDKIRFLNTLFEERLIFFNKRTHQN